MSNYYYRLKCIAIILTIVTVASIFCINIYCNKSNQNPEAITSIKNKSKKIDSKKLGRAQELIDKFKENNSEIKETDNQATKSGPLTVEKAPWENETNFLETLDKYSAFTRICAFRTVIPDPLQGEEYNVHLAAKLLSGTVVLPGEVFSQNKTLGPYTPERGFKEGPTYSENKLITSIGGGICKIASTLYNLVRLSNVEVVERHPHSKMVQYVPLGQDATVCYGKMDFRFKNNTSYPIVIWAQGNGNILYMAFYGSSKSPKVSWIHKIVSIDKMKTIFRENKSIPIDTRVVLEGCNGYQVKSWLLIKKSDSLTEKSYLGTDKYATMPEIIEIGTNESTQ